MTGTITTTELRWQCRRGMLELDILLNNFVDSMADEFNCSRTDNRQVELLTQQQKKSFKLLLSYPDQTLLDLLLGNAVSNNPEISSIVKQIQSTSSN